MARPLSKPSKSSKSSKSDAPKQRPPQMRAPSARAPMSKAPEMTRAELSILARMAELPPESPRYRVLEAALAFKSSWVILGEHLADVLKDGSFREWGYASFERYCADEVHVTAATAKKLVRSYAWLGSEAPEYLPPRSADEVKSKRSHFPPGPLPDLNAVSVLADARVACDEARVPEDAYLAIKQAALEGESASALRRALKDSIPEHLRPKPADDKVRHLRRALTAVVKVIDELREWDSGGESAGDELLVQAETLRDAIAVRLPRAE